MSGSPEISVVVATHNRAGCLAELWARLEAQSLSADRFELIVVDDCSTDNTWDTLLGLQRTAAVPTRVLQTTRNSGGAAVPRNVGWRATSAPITAFIDDDCAPAATWLEAGLTTLQADPRLGVVQGRVKPPPDFDPSTAGRWQVWRDIEGPSPWFEGTNIFYRREALEQAGGFNEEMGIWGEDTDLGWKVLEAGWNRGYCSEALVRHDVEVRDWRWWLRFSWKDRNLVRVAATHPQIRREAFWRPWAMRREDAVVAWAALGVVLGMRWRPAILLAAPYVWSMRPRPGEGNPLIEAMKIVSVDAVRLTARLTRSLEEGVLVL